MRQITRIKGLSEVRRLPRLGKIRLGVRVPRPKTKDCRHPEGQYCFRCSFPKEVSYFVLPPEAREIYGPEPTEIDIMFPVDDPSVVFPQAYKWYGADQGLKCKGDGETAIRRLADVADPKLKEFLSRSGQKDEDLVEVPCPCPMLDNGKCGPKGCLMVLLPRVGCGGVYQIDTGSVINLTEINSTIEFLQSLLGRIAMVPLKLRRVPQAITFIDPKTGKTSTKTHYMLKLVFEGAMTEVMRLRNDRMALPGYQPTSIAPPVEDGPEPTSECPMEINGEVVDMDSGELISANHDAEINKFGQIRAYMKAEGVSEDLFVSFLISKGKIKEGQKLEDLSPEASSKLTVQGIMDKTICAYKLWLAEEVSKPPAPSADENLVLAEDWINAMSDGGLLEFLAPIIAHEPEQEEVVMPETSASKLAKAEALAPQVTLQASGVYRVPASKEGADAHTVSEDEMGWACDCAGYGFRAQGDPGYQCSHIMAARMAAPRLKV